MIDVVIGFEFQQTQFSGIPILRLRFRMGCDTFGSLLRELLLHTRRLKGSSSWHTIYFIQECNDFVSLPSLRHGFFHRNGTIVQGFCFMNRLGVSTQLVRKLILSPRIQERVVVLSYSSCVMLNTSRRCFLASTMLVVKCTLFDTPKASKAEKSWSLRYDE